MMGWPESVYTQLAMMGIDPKRVKTNYTLGDNPDNPDGRAILAVPDIKVAITVDRDLPAAFKEAGWIVVPLQIKNLEVYHEVFGSLMSVHQANQRAKTLDTSANTSRHEQWLIDACISRGLPTPDRNLRIDNPDYPGKLLTIPDLAWEKDKVAFFVDGLYWHGRKENIERFKILDADMTDEERQRKLDQDDDSREKDNRIRSIMQREGWVTLGCSDRDLERPGGVTKQVDSIEKVLNDKRKKREDKAKLLEMLQSQGMDIDSLNMEGLQ